MEPLPTSFMLTGLLGFIIVSIYTYTGKLSLTWGITLDIFAVILIAASLKSLKV